MLNALLALALVFASIAAVAGPLGQIDELSGSVKLLDQQGKERVAAKGAEVTEGDRILTAEGGRVQLRLSDGGYLALRPNTELVFKRYVLNESVPAESSFWVSLLKGGFRSITGLIGRINPAGYRIETETATIGVRGTDHEPYYIPQSKTGDNTLGEPGTYDKLNSGRSFLETPKGVLDLKPGQVGFAPRLDLAPRLLPKAPDFFRDQPVVPKQYLGKGDSREGPSAKQQASKGDFAAAGGSPKNEPQPAIIGLTPTTSILAPSTNVFQPLPAVPVAQVPVPQGIDPKSTVSPVLPTERTSDAAPPGQTLAATTPAADAPGHAVSANTPAADARVAVSGNGGVSASPNGNANGLANANAAPGGTNGNANGQASAAGGNAPAAGNRNANGLAAATPAGNAPGNGGGSANGIGNAIVLTNGANPPATNTPVALPAQAAPAVANIPAAANPAGNVPTAPAAANASLGGVGNGNAAAAPAAPAAPAVANRPAVAPSAPAVANVPAAASSAPAVAGLPAPAPAAAPPAAPVAPPVANVPAPAPAAAPRAAPVAPPVANVPAPAPRAVPVAPPVANVPAPAPAAAPPAAPVAPAPDVNTSTKKT